MAPTNHSPNPHTPRHNTTHTPRRAIRAFEGWAHDTKGRKLLAGSERVLNALIALSRNEGGRLTWAREHLPASMDLKAIVFGMLARLGKVGVRYAPSVRPSWR